MSADPVVLDTAVRRLWALQPSTYRCGCVGCFSMIQILYKNMIAERATPESPVVRSDG